jgi:hypothetical protein
MANFPLPDEQPSRDSSVHPFISPRPIYAETDLLGCPDHQKQFRGIRTRRCLLADDDNQRNFVFADEGLPLGVCWRKVNVVLPMPEIETDGHRRVGGRPMGEMEGPFHRVKQTLKVRVVTRTPDGSTQTVVNLSTPIRFGTCLDTMPGGKNHSYLPAYVQLFHENGELRDCDPLPLYERYEDMVVEPEVAKTKSEPLAPDYKSLYPSSAAPSRAGSPVASSSGSTYRPPSPSGSSGGSEAADTESAFSHSPATVWRSAGAEAAKLPNALTIPTFA